MRKILISLLMASAAMTPAVVHAQDSAAERRAAREQARSERQAAREDRSSTREERTSAREERAVARDERPVQRGGPESAVVVDQRGEVIRDRSIQVERSRANASNRASERAAQQAQRIENRAARQAQYAALREARRNAGPPPVSRVPQPNTQPPPPPTSRSSTPVRWNTGWRHNHNYDWYNWRNKNRWLFSLGFYSDPFGWGYSPFSIGWRMWPSYYSNRYWLNDPWQYRLPYAPPGTRWIRYYDDAILVDMWSGQVVDVIYDFFW